MPEGFKNLTEETVNTFIKSGINWIEVDEEGWVVNAQYDPNIPQKRFKAAVISARGGVNFTRFQEVNDDC